MVQDMTVENIIKIKVTCHDDELDEDFNGDELAEFIVETLSMEFRKDLLEFEVIKYDE